MSTEKEMSHLKIENHTLLRASQVALVVKNLPANTGDRTDEGAIPGLERYPGRSLSWEDPLEEKWQPTPVFFPGESHGQRSLAGYSVWSRKESDMTERLTHTRVHFRGVSKSFTISSVPSVSRESESEVAQSCPTLRPHGL